MSGAGQETPRAVQTPAFGFVLQLPLFVDGKML